MARNWIVLATAVGCLVAFDATAQTVFLSETEFPDAGIDSFIAGGRTDPTFGPASHVGTQSSGGNPGPYRRVNRVLPRNSSIGVREFLVDPANVYDPRRDGPGREVTLSVDLIVNAANADGAPVPGTVGGLFAVRQDGVVYIARNAPLIWTGPQGFVTQTQTLTAADFQTATGETPDFSASGSPIEFGISQTNTRTGSAAVLTLDYGYDNFLIQLLLASAPDDTIVSLEAQRRSLGLTARAAHRGPMERMNAGHFCAFCLLETATLRRVPETARFGDAQVSGKGSAPLDGAGDLLLLMASFAALSQPATAEVGGAGVMAMSPSEVPDTRGSAAPRSDRWTAYTSVSGTVGETDATAGQAALDYDGVTATFGIDRFVARSMIAGAAVAFGSIDGDLDGGGRSETSSYTGMVYAGWQPSDGTYLNAVASYGFSEIDQDRTTAGGGRATARPDADTFAVSVSGGADRPFTLLPGFGVLAGAGAGIDFVHSRIDGYTETASGGATAYTVEAQTADSARASVFLRAAAPQIVGNGLLTPHLRVGYAHELINDGERVATRSAFGPGETRLGDDESGTVSLSGGVYYATWQGSSIGVTASGDWGTRGSTAATFGLSGRIRF